MAAAPIKLLELAAAAGHKVAAYVCLVSRDKESRDDAEQYIRRAGRG